MNPLVKVILISPDAVFFPLKILYPGGILAGIN
jgi:hypothetical protein